MTAKMATIYRLSSPRLRGGYKKRRKRKGGTRKKMKGGYAQFASNDPMTPGFSSPKPGPLPWATGPLSKSRQINCQDNYNHYTGKSSRFSCIRPSSTCNTIWWKRIK